MTTIWGINDCSHDAALSVIHDGKIVFAAHAERYSKIKNDHYINSEIVSEALEFGTPDLISYFEKRWKKRLRLAMHGGISGDERRLYKNIIRGDIKEVQFGHHYSHAAAGYFTSKFENATIVVIDAIGEFDTASIWEARGGKIKRVFNISYPMSFGLFYSAFTHLVGLEPAKEEYILMGMAAFGDDSRYYDSVSRYFPKINYQPINMHKGIQNWMHKISSDQDKCDIAAAVQKVYEKRLMEFMNLAASLCSSRNLVFMGGCSLNCKANTLLFDMWDDIWIMPNPGDAGSSLGAALAAKGSHVEWPGPYLGHCIGGKYPVKEILNELFGKGIVAVASGRAEFGPRALGNRSILADPRKAEHKDIVNEIKRREKFRPFAPVVMQEHADKWFDISGVSPYMQYAVNCRRPKDIPSVVHADGTSRVQTVSRLQHPGLHEVLREWHSRTGVPVLLNTSLNVKNQPLLNDIMDVSKWSNENPGIRILT